MLLAPSNPPHDDACPRLTADARDAIGRRLDEVRLELRATRLRLALSGRLPRPARSTA